MPRRTTTGDLIALLTNWNHVWRLERVERGLYVISAERPYKARNDFVTLVYGTSYTSGPQADALRFTRKTLDAALDHMKGLGKPPFVQMTDEEMRPLLILSGGGAR